jgi:hypothetical protein
MLGKFTIAKNFGPYRFIGKTLYIRAWQETSIAIERASWHVCDWVFKALDAMTEYSSDQVNNHALFTWERFDDKNQLMGYTIGRFMKAGTPVPDGMDYYDIDAATVAQGWAVGTIDEVRCLDQVHNDLYGKTGAPTFAALAEAGYDEQCRLWSAQAFPVGYPKNPKPCGDGKYYVGNFVPCVRK